MSEENEVEYVTENWVYVGIREGSKGKRIFVWRRVGHVTQFVFDKQIAKNASIGSIYCITNVPNKSGSFYNAGERAPKFIGFHENRDQIKEWEIEEQHAKNTMTHNEMIKQSQKDNDPMMEDIYSRVKEFTNKLNNAERLAFASKLMECVFYKRP